MFHALKAILPVNCRLETILDLHCLTKQPHDTQVSQQVLGQNLDRLPILTAAEGYDTARPRELLRAHDVHSLIKHRELSSLYKAYNAHFDGALCHQRSMAGSTLRALKLRFGDRLCSRAWYAQFRGLVLKCAAKNIETPSTKANNYV